MVEIPLTNSDKKIIVDDILAAELLRHKWNLDRDGYARRSVRNNGKVRTIRIHRLILSLSWNDKDKDVDHINFNRLDNRLENLRVLTPSKNRGRHYHAQLSIWEDRNYGGQESYT